MSEKKKNLSGHSYKKLGKKTKSLEEQLSSRPKLDVSFVPCQFIANQCKHIDGVDSEDKVETKGNWNLLNMVLNKSEREVKNDQ